MKMTIQQAIQMNRMTIGLLVDRRRRQASPHRRNAWMGRPSIYDALSTTIRKLGHDLIALPLDRDEDWNLCDELEGLSGLILIAQDFSAHDVEDLAKLRPVVALTHDATSAGVPSFFVDVGYHAAVAVQELRARGHRRIALLCNDSLFHMWMSTEIRRGFELAHRTALGLASASASASACDDLVFYRPLTVEAGEGFYRELRQHHADVTAAVVYGGLPAAGMAAAAAAAGEALPEALSVVRLTDVVNEPDWGVGFAHFRCPNERMARDAIAALRRLLPDADADADEDAGEDEHEQEQEQQQQQQQNWIHRPYYGQFVPGQSVRAIE